MARLAVVSNRVSVPSGDGAKRAVKRLDHPLRQSYMARWRGLVAEGQAAGALRADLPVDTFVVYTDNETWAGSVHPHQALRQYRDWSGIDARLAVVGLTATDFTIADPADPGMLDIAGFDSALPTLLTDFSARAI